MRSAAAAWVARARPPRSSKAFENRSYAIRLGPLIEFAVNCNWNRPPILDGYVYLECFRHCEYERDVSERPIDVKGSIRFAMSGFPRMYFQIIESCAR
jgi:hypothetical protein